MKFEDVKVGDIVYIEKEVIYGYGQSKTFYIKDEVAKVTKTQFVTKTNRRYKKDGSEIGKYMSYALKEGDKFHVIRGMKEVKDESKEVATFIKKINLEKHLNKAAENINIELNSKLTVEELNIILDKIDEIQQLIEKQ